MPEDTAPKATNVVWHRPAVAREDRERLAGHRGAILWFTGLSGSGKSTVAHEVEARLCARGVRTYVLDGDNLRHGLNRNLGFSPEDREENIRRAGEVARLFLDAGIVVLVSLISPFRADRDRVREAVEPGRFTEIHVACGLEECERRDPKGLYRRARAGEIPEFTGLSSPYEEPLRPEIVLRTDRESLSESAERVISWLEAAGHIGPSR